MKLFLQLLTHKGIFLLVTVLTYGILYELKVDSRIIMLCVSIWFILSGLGQFINAKQDVSKKILAKTVGIFFLSLGGLMFITMVVMLVTGKAMQIE